jgi:sugar O-acyltransferase (sialic acid O-acetyltransferase NeuD family)
MERVVLYGVGSPILVDVEETLYRAGVTPVAGVHNIEGRSYLSGGVPVLTPRSLGSDILSLPYLVPLFTPGHRQQAANEAVSLGFTAACRLFDPTSILPRSLQAEPGVFINAGCSIGAQCRFEAFVLINRSCSISHDAVFGRFVSIGPGVVIAGGVTIGKGTMVGAGAVVIPEVVIGENAVVAAGSVVTRDVPAYCMVAGNPARILKQDIAGYRDITVT